MDHVLIIIAGMPAAGKTTFANYLSEELRIPLVCKDRLKEILFDKLHYDAKAKSETQKFGALAYSLSWYFCEEIMKSGQPLIFESNLRFDTLDAFRNAVEACRNFSYGDHVIRVDTSDFSRVCYHNITQKILSIVKQGNLI